MKAVVLGSGVVGVTTAYFLAKLGHEVTVIDRRAGPADETSFANGGVVGASQIEPWAGPGLPLKILRWIGRDDAPLLFRPGQIPHMWRWGVRFLKSCTEERFQRSLETSLRLTLASLEAFAEVRAENQLDYDFAPAGALKVYLSPDSLAEAARELEPLAALGMPYRVVDRAECIAIEPALESSAASLAGGIHCPKDEMGDCRKFTRALAVRCEARGVAFRFGTTIEALVVAKGRVEAVATDRGRVAGDAFVVALASYSPRLFREFGIEIPVCPVKGVTVTVPVAGWRRPVRGAVIDYSRLFGLVRIGDRLRVSGSAEITGFSTVPADVRCQALVNAVLDLFPDFQACLKAGAPLQWAGVRPNTPDSVPILGPTPFQNLFLNTGHGPEGWSTSCGSAKVVANLVSGHPPGIDLRGLTLDRFFAGY